MRAGEHWAALTASAGLLACTTAAPEPTVERSACERQAVLLERPVQVLRSPHAGTPLAVSLGRGDAIYLCGTRGQWQAVMPGEPADCSRRAAGEPPCRFGWLPAVPAYSAPD